MNIFSLFFGFLLLDVYSGELPRKLCMDLKPFLTSDHRCDNFSNVCIKKGDKDCESFLGICAQCPATNYSVLMFYDIAKIKVELENTKLNINNTAAEMRNTKEKLIKITNQLKERENGKNIIYILLWIIIIINILMFFLLFLEIRFKIITKLIEKRKIKDNNQYKILQSRKSTNKGLFISITEINSKFASIEEKLDVKIESKLDDILEILQNNLNSSKSQMKTKFSINEQIIELKIEERDNCVAVKRRICNKLSLVKSDDYKMLKLKCNSKTLDDNQYFLSFNIPPTAEILCEKDMSINPDNILVVKTEGNIFLPKFIQIQKDQRISELKRIIPGIQDKDKLRIFIKDKKIKDKNKLKILDDMSTVAESNMIDDDIIYFIIKEVKELTITSIFDDRDSIVIDYDSTDNVLSLKNLAALKLNSPNEDFVLIQKIQLSEDAFVFQYNFTERNPVKYCRIMKLDDIDIGDSLNKGPFSDLLKAKFRKRNLDILIKKYQLNANIKFVDNIYIIKEIITFQMTKSHPRFVNLFGVYKDEEFLYVALENMELGTLKSFIKHNQPTEEDIKKWAYQMLEGLKYLHEHNIIHRDLNPSSLLLDKSKDLKLSSFNLSKYTDLHLPSSINMSVNSQPGFPVKYLAPEIVNNDNYTAKADVWSFGAILIKIITKKGPFHGVRKQDITKGFYTNKTSDYDCSEIKSEEFKRIIELCMKIDPKYRATVEELLKDKSLKLFYS